MNRPSNTELSAFGEKIGLSSFRTSPESDFFQWLTSVYFESTAVDESSCMPLQRVSVLQLNGGELHYSAEARAEGCFVSMCKRQPESDNWLDVAEKLLNDARRKAMA